ncbi:hypothetical protein JKF63_05546 [Porcisia hertigi]|uniref:non-specific serine/threonine protein kinase n=1 Tax=Porcisia hertigi TaxID=2761500 RepID=A0A836LHR6_9TRYP|nr:hypothetical protein JKF63_05546 [Porcisia hertigi]
MQPSDVLQTPECANVFPFEVCNLLLGRGGSGQVFLGRIGGSDKYVAIKKRYGRYHANGNAKNCILAKRPPLSYPSQETQSPPSQNALFFSGKSHVVCRNGSGLQQLEFGDGTPVHQRREQDLGEESVSQTAAIFQQQGCCTLDENSGHLAKPTAVPSLMDEVSVLSYIGPHPQIVRFLGSYTTSKRANFFIMELMDSDVGRELKEGNTSLREERVCAAIAYSVLLALDKLHSHAVAHRDIKPGNILLKQLTEPEEWACIYLSSNDISACPLSHSSGESHCNPTLGASTPACNELAPGIRKTNGSVSYVKATLGDFSAAHSTSCFGNVKFSDIRGTLHYKSPEQLMGKRSVVSENSTAVDLWGLGCTLYEMVTGTRPFAGSSELQVLMSILDTLGSGIQSYPVATRNAILFDGIPVSPAFLDFLQRLLCLDPARRCTAKEALCHPFLAPMRDCALRSPRENPKPTDRVPHVIGIPLTLKYASLTHIPELRFSRISRTPLKGMNLDPSGSSASQQFSLSGSLAPPLASGAEVAALPILAEGETAPQPSCKGGDVHHWDDRAPATGWRHEKSSEDRGEKETPSKRPQLHHCPDTTGTSFFSESSYLHWSEIRPHPQPSVPLQSLQHKEEVRSSSSGSRAAALFGNAAIGNTPSLSTTANGLQQQAVSASMHLSTDTASRNTVSRALNISDSSVKDTQAECNGSHVDFDLSPLSATQLFGTDAVTSACPVAHPAAAFLPRRAQPVLQLASGSTFTASNLRANSSFERENLIVGWCGGGNGASTSSALGISGPSATVFAGHCSTPCQHQGRRPTPFAGRMLCFSEETDPFTRRSGGSSACQRSCVNSLVTSPAPVGRMMVEECSPQPSPIRPVGVATRSQSGLPVAADRSGLSSDDSGVGLGWIGVPPGTAAVQANGGDAPEAAPTTATTTPALVRDVGQGAEASAAVPPMLSSVRLQSSQNVSRHHIPIGSGQPSNSPRTRRCVHRIESAAGRSSRSRECSNVASTCAVTRSAAADPPDASCSHQQQQNTNLVLIGGGDTSSWPMLPLPIPLSVAAVCQPVSQSLQAPPPLSCTPTTRALHETPRTQRFSCPMSALRTSRTAANSKQQDSSQLQGVLTTCVHGGDAVSSAVSFLCNQDVNAQATGLAHKVCPSVGVAGSASGVAPRDHVAAATPLVSLRVCTHSSQRHCTPSSNNPVLDVPLPINADGSNHFAMGTRVASSRAVTVVRASRTESSVGGPHTPLPVDRSTPPPSQHCRAPLLRLSPKNFDSDHRSVRDHESESIETPLSKQRGSMKRAREEAVSSEDAAAVRQSVRMV